LFYSITDQEAAMADENPIPRRRAGGQPRNLNALKHGFYSRLYRAGEIEDLEETGAPSLSDEITMLRVLMRRMFEQAMQDDPDLETWIKCTDMLGKTSHHLSALMRAQANLAGQSQDVASALTEALAEVLKELEA
jgi:hypothetical protein